MELCPENDTCCPSSDLSCCLLELLFGLIGFTYSPLHSNSDLTDTRLPHVSYSSFPSTHASHTVSGYHGLCRVLILLTYHVFVCAREKLWCFTFVLTWRDIHIHTLK